MPAQPGYAFIFICAGWVMGGEPKIHYHRYIVTICKKCNDLTTYPQVWFT